MGTGKSFFAGCTANALMEKEIPVCMTNFTRIINDLAASFEGRNEYIDRLCRYSLLILDHFGMKRDTGCGLEQVYNVIDRQYRSGRPDCVTGLRFGKSVLHPPPRPELLHFPARLSDQITIFPI